MIRTFAALSVLLAGTASLLAQQLPVGTGTPPASTGDVVVDPMAVMDTTPKNANLLTGMYATRAVIELCSVPVDAAILERMTRDQQGLESRLTMDAATATEAYARVKADVETTTPDCAEGSADRQSVDAVVAIYTDPAPGLGTQTAPAPDAPATPAQ